MSFNSWERIFRARNFNSAIKAPFGKSYNAAGNLSSSDVSFIAWVAKAVVFTASIFAASKFQLGDG
jgi:hypothetical protein